MIHSAASWGCASASDLPGPGVLLRVPLFPPSTGDIRRRWQRGLRGCAAILGRGRDNATRRAWRSLPGLAMEGDLRSWWDAIGWRSWDGGRPMTDLVRA